MRITAALCIIASCYFGSAQKSMILHVTNANGGFSTDVILRNNFAASLPYHLVALDAQGQIVADVNGTIEALSSTRIDSNELFNVNTVSHFYKSDETFVTVGVSYQANIANAGVANVLESSDRSDLWIVQPGLQSLSWDGLAIVNRSDESIPIYVDQRDEQGELIKTMQIHPGLAPNAKTLYVLSTDFDLTYNNALFNIRSDQAIGVIALRGTHSNAVLWQNLALPLPSDEAPDTQLFGEQRISFRSDMSVDTEWAFSGGATGNARNVDTGQIAPYSYEKLGRNSMSIQVDSQTPRLFRLGLTDELTGLYQELVDGAIVTQGSFWMYP